MVVLIAGFIKKHFGNYEAFQKELQTEAMSIQGSGWIYLAYDGKLKIIPVQVRDDILLLIDWWE